MNIELGYGPGVQTLSVDDSLSPVVLLPKDAACASNEEAEIRRALRHPIGTPPIGEILRPGEKIAIITSDLTRPMPTKLVLPPLLDELYAAGVAKEDITLVFALGSHRKQTDEERKKLAGEPAFSEIACIDGDVEDCVSLGTTRRGTPVDIVRTVAEADRRICLGNIEFHYFAGYSGGAKAIMPGVAAVKAIMQNHSLMVNPGSKAARLEGNPLREDIEEAASMVGVDFILNVVLDAHKHVIRAFAGDVTKAHREGCAFLDQIYGRSIEQKADIVVVSQGGAPKDVNLYQTQKALDNAKHAVKEGGVIILVGECKEGPGGDLFEEWMTTAEKPRDIVDRLGKGFRLGGHKAAAIAMVMAYADIYLVSRMEDSLCRKMFFHPYDTVQQAYDEAQRRFCGKGSVLIMPYGGSTLPLMKENNAPSVTP